MSWHLYWIWHRDGRLGWIGQSYREPLDRCLEHLRRAGYGPLIGSWAIGDEEYDTEADVLAAEKAAIHEHLPLWNRQHNMDNPLREDVIPIKMPPRQPQRIAWRDRRPAPRARRPGRRATRSGRDRRTAWPIVGLGLIWLAGAGGLALFLHSHQTPGRAALLGGAVITTMLMWEVRAWRRRPRKRRRRRWSWW